MIKLTSDLSIKCKEQSTRITTGYEDEIPTKELSIHLKGVDIEQLCISLVYDLDDYKVKVVNDYLTAYVNRKQK